MLAHDVNERERVADVVGVVLDGLAHGLADGLEASEVDHAIGVVLVKDLGERRAVVDVGLVEGEVCRGVVTNDGLDAVEDLARGVGEVVNHDHLVAAAQKLDDRVASDEAGTSGHEHAGIGRCDLLAHRRSFRRDELLRSGFRQTLVYVAPGRTVPTRRRTVGNAPASFDSGREETLVEAGTEQACLARRFAPWRGGPSNRGLLVPICPARGCLVGLHCSTV